MSRLEPTGVGVYLRDLSEATHGKPDGAAAVAAAHGVDFVALAACWQEADRHTPMNVFDLDDYGRAFAKRGIDVWVWGYPWGTAERVEQFCRTMAQARDAAGAVGVLLDPELGFKGERRRHMLDLLEGTVDTLDEASGLGFTSYGLISAHPSFPWNVAGGWGWGSPQFYTVPRRTALAGLDQWRQAGWRHLVASVPTFGPNSGERTAAYAGAIREHCDGVIFWSWRSTLKLEWRAIEAVARRDDPPAPEELVA
ncbi:MAG: hypothetical protein GWN84_20635 [Gammaproteobacteria bacterium]|nr:hypothetical protein [Gammaproteobacteria bacterium]NIR85169.1 hypothetical protein [Gammaproteobacteria bacterium]NIU06218.1 hypothetical protein [Gammaproteobacteria bacterium]NIX87491.1 hypothetical protein [Gammaproteobacteria bacterium]